MLGVAVKLADAPAHIELPAGPTMLTDGAVTGVTVMVMLFELTAAPLIHAPVAVKETVTA